VLCVVPADSGDMTTAVHTLTTTAHTQSGLVPICRCGWKPARVVRTRDEVEALVREHNDAFELESCPRCGNDLATVRSMWSIESVTTHYADKRCPACRWSASTWPE
jgi:hypothetical protein